VCKKKKKRLKQAPRVWLGKFFVTRVLHDEMSNETFSLLILPVAHMVY
jgi:hypothetical protein